VGDLTDDQAAMVDWALARFQEAGLHLPSEIEVTFDTNAELCNLRLGTCHPPNGAAAVSVCRKGPATSAIVLANRLTLLHELAHLWHWTEGDGTGWPDDSAIVGGEFNCEGTPWEDESVERVAETITWGLYNELRRPVRTDFTCAELYVQFEQLTGSEPLGPLEGICLPDSSN
jgi:hypothetical protein